VIERYKNAKHSTFVHFGSNGKIETKAKPIKEFFPLWQHSYETCRENWSILAFYNETFAFLK
jgi:hypothetical protein